MATSSIHVRKNESTIASLTNSIVRDEIYSLYLEI
jgi:hypothetical protein